MEPINTADYLARSREESTEQPASFNVVPLPKAPAIGGILDTVGAVFRQNNTIVSALNDRSHRFDRNTVDDPDFRGVEHVPAGHTPYAYKYDKAKNLDDIRDIFFQTEDELRDKQLEAGHPIVTFIAGVPAGVIEPFTLFPGTIFYKGIGAGLSATKSAIGVGGAMALQVTGQEYLLHETQTARTLEESAYNVMGSAFIGASIGAFAGTFLTSASGRRASKQTAQIFEDGDITPPGVLPLPDGTPNKPGGGGLAPLEPGHADYPIKGNALEPVIDNNALALPGGDKLTSYSTERFHGTSREIDELQNIDERQVGTETLTFGSVSMDFPVIQKTMTNKNTSIYGNGFYTTSNFDLAKSYTKKGGRLSELEGVKNPTIYKLEEKAPIKLKDLDKPLQQDEEFTEVFNTIATKEIPEWARKAVEEVKTKAHDTVGEFIDALRRKGVLYQINAKEYQDFITNEILYPLANLGYRGFTHVGGQLQKTKRHKVNIYWYPKDDLNVFKIEQGASKGGGGNVSPGQTSAGFAAPEGKSVGAANVMEMALEGQSLHMAERTAKVLGTTVAKITPSGRMATNPLGYIRLAGEQIFENNWRYHKNYSMVSAEGAEKGFRPSEISLETRIKVAMGKVTSVLMEIDNLYFEQSGISRDEKFKIEKDFFMKKGLTRDEFSDAIFFDVINGFTDTRENVGKAARLIHNFFEEYKDLYTELGVYPEGMTVRNSINYFTHYYNVPWIQDPRNRPQAEQILTDHYKHVNNLVEVNLPDIKAFKKAAKKAKKLLKEQTKVEKELTKFKAKQEKLNLKNIIDNEIDARIAELEEGLKAGTPAEVKKAMEQAAKIFRDTMPEEIFDAQWQPRDVVLDDDQIWVSVQNTLDNIMNLNQDRFKNQYLARMGIGNNPKPTNHRTLMIPTEQIAPMLIRDYRKVLPMFARSMIPNYYITKFAKEMGFEEDTKVTDVGAAPGEVIGGLMSLAREELDMRLRDASPEESKRLYDAFNAGQSDIKAGLELLLGIFGNGFNTHDTSFGKFSKIMSGYNYSKMMGYMMISAFTDPATVVMRNGYAAMIHQSIGPMIQGLKAVSHNKALMQSIGRGVESFTGYRLKAYADQNDLVGSPTKLEKAFNYIVTSFGNMSLMSPWTDLMQHVTTNAFIGEMLTTTIGYKKNVDKYQALQTRRDELQNAVIPDIAAISAIEREMAQMQVIPDATRTKYLALGLTDHHFKILYEQWARVGGVEDGVYWLDWGAWDMSTKRNIDALGDFQAALIKEIDSTIIVPGLGDKPLFARTDLGNTLLQFKGFAFGSTNRIFISGLTHTDANFYNGIILQLFLGALGYIITSILKGKEIDTSLENMAFEAIDRSGLIGILMEVPLIMQKMGFLPGVGTSRYQSRDWVGALGGPALGTLSEWVALANKFKNANENPLQVSDANKAWRQVPWNNIWWLDGINRNMGITDEAAIQLGFEDNRK